ncbi:MAG: hypothetical protein PVF58_12790 [Candidatus Methanofastidiosia archaeon]|jgi:hypothetical protein
MDIHMPVLISYTVGITASVVLGFYFLYDFATRKLRASLAWGIGILLYSLGEATDVYVNITGEITLGKPGLFAALLVVACAMVLLYYGTSLLFFTKESFFREKMAVIIFAIYIVYSAYLVGALPVEGFRQAVVAPIQLGLMTPVFVVSCILFYAISWKMEPGDPARTSSFLVSAAWGLLAINSGFRGLFLEYSPVIDALIQIIHMVAWILLLYGMTLGKAARI